MASGGFVTTYFAHEYRSPPVPLVALISCPEHHKQINEYFLHSLKPPLVSLCCNEPIEQFVPRAFSSGSGGKHQDKAHDRSHPGILKADWFTKHRQRRPAAAVVIINRHELVGDPNTWNRMLYTLKFIKDAVTSRGAGMIVAVAQPPDMGDLPSDRVTAISHNLSLDPRAILPLVVLDPTQPINNGLKAKRDASLKACGSLVSDQCAAYYARRARHVAEKHAARQASCPDGKLPQEMNARACIKLAVYAEFRQDWRAAVAEYQAAYGHVRSIIQPNYRAVQLQSAPRTPSSHGMHPSQSLPSMNQALSQSSSSLMRLSQYGSPSPLGIGAMGINRGSFASNSGRLLDGDPSTPMSLSRHGSMHGHHASWAGGETANLNFQNHAPWNSEASPRPGLERVSQSFTVSSPAGQQSISTAQNGYLNGPQLSEKTVSISIQQFAQAARVAELLQLKLIILLAYRDRLEEALAQANTHIQLFMRPPVELPLPAAIAHKAYIIRQLQITSEVVTPKLEGSALAGIAVECSRNTLLMTAAQIHKSTRMLTACPNYQDESQVAVSKLKVAVERRYLLDELTSSRTDGSSHPDIDLSLVKRGPYVGTVALKSAADGSSEMSEQEFLLWLEAEALRSPGSTLPTGSSMMSASTAGSLMMSGAGLGAVTGLTGPCPSAIDVINSALILMKDGSVERQRNRLGLLLADEHVTLGNLSAARKLLLQVALTYRREDWELPMAQALLLLREVSQRLRLPTEHVTYCLELAAVLSHLSPDDVQALSVFCQARGMTLPAPEQLSASSVASLLSGVHDVARLPSIMKTANKQATQSEPGTPTSVSSVTPVPRTFTYQVEYVNLALAGAASNQAARRNSLSGASTPASNSNSQHITPGHISSSQSVGGAAVSGKQVADGLTKDGKPLTTADLMQRHHQQDYGWSRVLGVAIAFPAVMPANATTVDLHVALHNTLPSVVPISSATVSLTDEMNNVMQARLLPDDGDNQGTAQHLTGTQQEAAGMQLADLDVDLQPGVWTHLTTQVTPKGVGRLHVDKLTIHIGRFSSMTFHVSSFPSNLPTISLGGLMEKVFGRDPLKCAPFAHVARRYMLGGPSIMVPHIGALPTLQLVGHKDRRAFVGEAFLVAAVVQVNQGLPTSVLEFAVKPLTPGLTVNDITITVDDRGALDKYHGQDLARVQLPSIGKQACHTARLWVTSKQAGKLALAVTLQCPALVTQVLEIDVDQPLELSAHLTAEPGSYILIPPSTLTNNENCLPLVVGQHALAHCAVRHACGGGDAEQAALELLHAEVTDTSAAGVSVLNDLRVQLEGSDGKPLITLGKSDVALLMTSLMPSHLMPNPVPLGSMQVSWRRKRKTNPGDSSQQHVKQGEYGVTTVAALPDVDLLELEQRQPCPNPVVTTSLQLPLVSIQEGLLSVKAIGPPQATAGISFTYTLQAQSFANTQMDLLVSLLDAPGFVLSGERTQQVSIPPRQAGGAAAISWLLVGHTAGLLALPRVRVSVPRFNATLTSQAANVRVLPF